MFVVLAALSLVKSIKSGNEHRFYGISRLPLHVSLINSINDVVKLKLILVFTAEESMKALH